MYINISLFFNSSNHFNYHGNERDKKERAKRNNTFRVGPRTVIFSYLCSDIYLAREVKILKTNIAYLIQRQMVWLSSGVANLSGVTRTNILHMRKQRRRSNFEADISAFGFATRIVQFFFFLYPKFQASSHPLCLYRPVCVRLVWQPHFGFLMTRHISCFPRHSKSFYLIQN